MRSSSRDRLVVVVFAANVFRAKPAVDSLLFAIALAVGIAPELLLAIMAINLAHGARRMADGDFDLVRADVTQQTDVDRVAATAGNTIDILANVAGIMDHFIPLGELDDDTWERCSGST